MNLLPKLKKKQAGQIGTAAETTPTTVLGDLTPLVNLIKPMRERMASMTTPSMRWRWRVSGCAIWLMSRRPI